MTVTTVIILTVTICLTNAATIVSVYDDVLAEQQPLTSKASCNYQSCDQLCRRLGFPGGACVGDRCECDNFLQSQEENEIPLNGKVVTNQDVLRHKDTPGQYPLNSVDSCDYRACEQLCRRLGFPGGACVDGRCKCDNFLQSIAENLIQDDDKYTTDVDVLEVGEPEEIVTTTDEKVAVNDNVLLEDEKPEIIARSLVSRASCDCNPRNCDLYCFRIHYTGGICVTGQCRCYK